MSDSLITVIVIVVAATLIFVVPLMTMADKIDATAQTQVETLVSDFVEEIRTTGKITQDKYDKFLENLLATGYTFDVEMEARNIGENPGKKTSQTAKDRIGENVYYTEYTSQIEEWLKTHNGVKELKTGSMVTVTVRNTDLTFAQQMKQFMYKIVGNDTATIIASKSGMIQQ